VTSKGPSLWFHWWQEETPATTKKSFMIGKVILHLYNLKVCYQDMFRKFIATLSSPYVNLLPAHRHRLFLKEFLHQEVC